MLWGTDWPHPNLKTTCPTTGCSSTTCPTSRSPTEQQHKLLVANPMRLYWPEAPERPTPAPPSSGSHSPQHFREGPPPCRLPTRSNRLDRLADLPVPQDHPGGRRFAYFFEFADINTFADHRPQTDQAVGRHRQPGRLRHLPVVRRHVLRLASSPAGSPTGGAVRSADRHHPVVRVLLVRLGVRLGHRLPRCPPGSDLGRAVGDDRGGASSTSTRSSPPPSAANTRPMLSSSASAVRRSPT